MARKSKKEMITFLRGHFRYYTMHSWNVATSYAHNVKIYRWVPKELQDMAYEILDVQRGPYEEIAAEFEAFAKKYDWKYQMWFNGRSGGYIVLGQGGTEKSSPYKIYRKPGLGMDMGEDFEDWDYQSLRKRYDLVKNFDETVERCKEIFLRYCRNYRVVEKTRMVSQKYKTLEEITC